MTSRSEHRRALARTTLVALLAFILGAALVALWRPAPAMSAARSSAPVQRLNASANHASTPVLDEPDENTDTADNWPAQAPSPEQVLYAQPSLMRTALARIGPRVPGKPNLYLLAFAGDGAEDVFHNEAEYAAQLLTGRFGPSAHALVLENHPSTLSTHPLASWSNLETALDGIAHAMNPQQDILLVYLTTHGSEDHNLLIDMDPLPLDQIGAADLAPILHKRLFKWKVVVVNACYSGGFVPDLRGPGTLVLTAARSDRSSFGCGSDSDATYFGRAWLIDALNQTPDFIAAFHRASSEIAGWEQRDQLTASEPQIDIGSGIAAQLALWRQGITAAPMVPFEPVSPPSRKVETLP